ncbi:hypothetical protein O9X98_10605 [Agrobacterium salinitolerans]|nr:hypothetical protein [Agrobacterium salinitolerans]
MIRELPVAADKGGERLASTLSFFSHVFAGFEAAGLMVRDFPKANDENILIFGYLIEAVRTAATVEKYERRHYDHGQMLAQIASHLDWAGHGRAADAVRARMVTATSEVRSGDQYEALRRLAHMRRFASFAWGVVHEMHGKGILPPHEDLEVYRQAYAAAVVSGDTPSYLLDVRELVEDIAAEVRTFDVDGAVRIEGFRTWKRRYYGSAA